MRRVLEKHLKSTLLILGGFALVTGLLLWSQLAQRSDTSVIARNGLHWHPTLTVYKDGVIQEIPSGIGLGAVHAPMHTHDEDVGEGIVHLEFTDVVHKGDTNLGVFFSSWGKDIHTAFGTLERMAVNGKDSAEYGEYALQEGDKIELYYSTTNTTGKTP